MSDVSPSPFANPGGPIDTQPTTYPTQLPTGTTGRAEMTNLVGSEALAAEHRLVADENMVWLPATYYPVGIARSVNSAWWVCTTAHTSRATFDPTEQANWSATADAAGAAAAAQAASAPLPTSALAQYYVTGAGSDSNSGRSWGSAFATMAAAATALGSNPGIIHVGIGTFLCNIKPYSNQRILGSGVGQTILQSASGSGEDVIQGAHFTSVTGTNQNGSPALTAGDNFVEVRDATIDGNKANNTAGFGIRLWGRGPKFDHIIVQNCANDGIWTEFAADISSFIPTNWIEGHHGSIFSLNNGGNGWTNLGPHDSAIGAYEAFGNGGWGYYSAQNAVAGSCALSLSGATGGTFVLYLNGNATSALAYNATAAQVQSALTALPGGSGITCSGGPLDSAAITTTFPSAYYLAVNQIGLTGPYGAISSTLTPGTAINNGVAHGGQWNLFDNTLGGAFGGALIDVDGLAADGNNTGGGIGLFLPPNSGSYTIRGSVAGGLTGAIIGGSNHRIALECNSNSGDAFQDAGVGLSFIDLWGSIPTGGNGIKGGSQFSTAGSSVIKARLSLTGTATLTTGTLNASHSQDLYGAGNGNPNVFNFPGTSLSAVGWSPQFPQSNGVLLTLDSTATTATAGTETLPPNPAHFIVIKDASGTSWKIGAYNV